MKRITPHLWYNNHAEEAAHFYISIFRNSKILDISRYGEAGAEVSGKAKGSVMTVTFLLNGQEFIALNGGPEFPFSPAVSFMVQCDTQDEVDNFWGKLSAGGQTSQCGWLKDKYGVSWQVVPNILREMIHDKDPKKTESVMQTMLKMKKIDIKTLQEAYLK